MGKAKHNKRTWRQTDIKDVEKFLDEQRLEERLGVNFAAKADHELFVIDTTPLTEEELKKKDEKNLIRLTRLEKKKRLLMQAPKCFQSLVNTSSVPDPIKKRNVTKRVTLSGQTIRKKKNLFKKKAEIAREDRKRTLADKEKQRKCRTEFDHDIWAEEDTKQNKKEPPKEWLSKDSVICNTLGFKVKKPPKLKTKTPPVVTPNPGESYNPTFNEHQELLNQVVTKELKVIKEEKHLDRVTTQMFRKVNQQQLRKEYMEELKQGLNNDQKDSSESDSEYKPINMPVVNKKKDLKKRRHIKEHNLEKGRAKEEAVEKKKLSDIYKLRFMKNSIETTEDAQKKKQLKRLTKKRTEIKIPHISSRPFNEPDPTFVPAEELSGNLINITPRGGGLVDQFTSLQRRGMANVSVPKTLKKAPKKRYTLASHRMPWEKFERPVKTKRNVKA